MTRASGGAISATSPSPESPKALFGCSICGAKSNTKEQYDAHLKEDRHLRAVDAFLLKNPTSPRTGPPASAPFVQAADPTTPLVGVMCEICVLTFADEQQKQLHEAGQLHQDVLKRLNTVYYNTYNQYNLTGDYANPVHAYYMDSTLYNNFYYQQ